MPPQSVESLFRAAVLKHNLHRYTLARRAVSGFEASSFYCLSQPSPLVLCPFPSTAVPLPSPSSHIAHCFAGWERYVSPGCSQLLWNHSVQIQIHHLNGRSLSFWILTREEFGHLIIQQSYPVLNMVLKFIASWGKEHVQTHHGF